MIYVENFFVLLLLVVVCVVLAFAVTYTITSLYIYYKRRPVKKYSFTEPALEKTGVLRREGGALDGTPDKSEIDGTKSPW